MAAIWVPPWARMTSVSSPSARALSTRAFAALVDRALADGEETLVILAHGGTQIAAMERYALPHADYYHWCAPNAGGYVLDAGDWAEQRVLHLLKTVQYTKEDAR